MYTLSYILSYIHTPICKMVKKKNLKHNFTIIIYIIFSKHDFSNIFHSHTHSNYIHVLKKKKNKKKKGYGISFYSYRISFSFEPVPVAFSSSGERETSWHSSQGICIVFIYNTIALVGPAYLWCLYLLPLSLSGVCFLSLSLSLSLSVLP